MGIIDYLVIILYFVVIGGIGYFSSKKSNNCR
jgi:Na+/proline symporter